MARLLIDRRDFVRGAGAAFLAGLLLSTAPPDPAPPVQAEVPP